MHQSGRRAVQRGGDDPRGDCAVLLRRRSPAATESGGVVVVRRQTDRRRQTTHGGVAGLCGDRARTTGQTRQLFGDSSSSCTDSDVRRRRSGVGSQCGDTRARLKWNTAFRTETGAVRRRCAAGGSWAAVVGGSLVVVLGILFQGCRRESSTTTQRGEALRPAPGTFVLTARSGAPPELPTRARQPAGCMQIAWWWC